MNEQEAAAANLFEAVRESLPALSPKMKAIAEYALGQPQDFIRRTSKDLCQVLETSEPTLIRFCKSYGKSGLAEFRIDLALSLVAEQREVGRIEPQHSDRRKTNSARKAAIARAAVTLIEGESALLLDNGSTAESFALELGSVAPLTVMTSGLLVAQAALMHDRHNVIVTGGTVRRASMCMTGRLVQEAVRGMQFDTFLMGADSISADRGISTFLEDEAGNTRILMQAARRTVVLADGSKFDKPSLHRICAVDAVDMIVTDLAEDDPAVARFRAAGAKLLLV
ncbi:DeoR/GlpR family DNA-binding transcription regulator [Tropicimonas sp. IMCC34043]|uniref:DeoR/GlpR family DNA-binding transcription regulator n=1 Tax=Tropicimonas sp. IMCC34043 TaxID=2248760 RepID=UPI000E23C7DD|nr:transcriptional regulator [Tropicimonas sp. IMCC34043]